MSNALVALIAANENCFLESFKTVKTIRISKFIWQQFPDCWASIVERQTAACLLSLYCQINPLIME